jgi:hypothetical protein
MGGKNLLRTISEAGLMAGKRFDEFSARARELVAAGSGSDLMQVPGWWWVISAQTFVDYLDVCPDILELAPQVRCPVLFLRGDREVKDVYPARPLSARRRPGRAGADCAILRRTRAGSGRPDRRLAARSHQALGPRLGLIRLEQARQPHGNDGTLAFANALEARWMAGPTSLGSVTVSHMRRLIGLHWRNRRRLRNIFHGNPPLQRSHPGGPCDAQRSGPNAAVLIDDGQIGRIVPPPTTTRGSRYRTCQSRRR